MTKTQKTLDPPEYLPYCDKGHKTNFIGTNETLGTYLMSCPCNLKGCHYWPRDIKYLAKTQKPPEVKPTTPQLTLGF